MMWTLSTVKMAAGREKALAREWRGSKISKKLRDFYQVFLQRNGI